MGNHPIYKCMIRCTLVVIFYIFHQFSWTRTMAAAGPVHGNAILCILYFYYTYFIQAHYTHLKEYLILCTVSLFICKYSEIKLTGFVDFLSSFL